MKPAQLWPAAVIGALGVTIAANVCLLVAASDPRQGIVEPDYYRKAVAWDSTMAQEGRNARLGWSLDARLEPAAEGAVLRVVLRDRDGAPLPAASIEVEAIHNRDAGHHVRAALADAGEGAYVAAVPFHHRGLWELRFDVERNGERFTASVRRDL